MSRIAPLPVGGHGGLLLVRPLLEMPKARLIATCEAAGTGFVADASNADPRFARTRLRALLPALADEGLDARRLAQVAVRLRRADDALEAVVDAACKSACIGPWPEGGPILLDARDLARLPAEIRLRLLRRAVQQRAQEGAVELGKLEALLAALDAAMAAGLELRRTLAGALLTLADDRLVIEAAPPRGKAMRPKEPLTTPAGPRRRSRKPR
jgi:tRNA(Ile)-lysidine synthase